MKKNISISFDEKLIRKIDDVCRVSERTKSWLVNKAVENYLEEIEDDEIAFQRSKDPDSEFITESELRKSPGKVGDKYWLTESYITGISKRI